MHHLISPTQKLVPLVKKHGPLLLPHKGKMIPHKYCQKTNKLIPYHETIRK